MEGESCWAFFFAVAGAKRYPPELVALLTFPTACLRVGNDMCGDLIDGSSISSCAQSYHVKPRTAIWNNANKRSMFTSSTAAADSG